MADRLLSEHELAAQLADHLRREPSVSSVRIGAQGAIEIQVVGQAESFSIGLDNLYRMYIMDPAQLDQIVDAMVQQVRALPQHLAAKAGGSPLNDLMPQIKDAQFLKQATSQGIDIVHQSLVGDLSIVYVADTPTSMRFLTTGDLDKNGVSLEELHAIALINLTRKTAQTGYMVAGEEGRKMVISQTRDSYDAARILLPEIQTQVAEYLGGPVIFGIPNRDFLVMLTNHDADFVREIAVIVAADYQNQPHPLSPKLYTIVDGTWAEYTPA